MSSNALIYDLILETRQATVATQKMVSESQRQAGQAGKGAGNQFAKNFQAALGGIAFGAIFNTIKNGVLGSVAAYKDYQKANTNLSGAIRAVNQREQEKIAVLKDSKASLEEKALAIGLNTADIYENTKATKSNEEAIKQAEAEITKQTRAFEDATTAVENNIKALEDKRDLEIQAIRNAKGYESLTGEQQKQEEDLLALNLESLNAQKAGDVFQVALLKNQIDAKKLDQSITENKIKQIDNQTDKVKDLYQVQIQALRVELQASKNKFDIDIEPAKRKLEDLRATSESIGGEQQLKSGISQMIADAASQLPKTIKESDFTNLRKKLEQKYKGIIPAGAISSSLSNLLQGGLTDVAQIETTFDRMTDIAAKGKSNFITMGSAVDQLAEQFRNERGALGETAGLTQEYISEILPKGLAIMQARGKLQGKTVDNLTQEERAQAKLTGLLAITSDKQGGYNEQLNDGLLETEKFTGNLEKLSQVFGQALFPAVNAIAKALAPIIEQLAHWIEQNPDFVVGVTVAAVVLTALAIAFFALTSPIGLVVLAIAGISIVIGALWAQFKNPQAVEAFKNSMEAIKKLFAGDFKGAFESTLKAVSSFADTWVGQLTKNLFNGFIEGTNMMISNWQNLARQIKDLPGLGGVAEMILRVPKIPKFAMGADFNAGIDKQLVSFWANRDERVIVQTPAQQNDNSTYSNTTNYNNYGNSSPFLSMAF